MLVKSELVAMANVTLAGFLYGTSPIVAYCLPARWTAYGYAAIVMLKMCMCAIDACNSDALTKNYRIMKVSLWIFFGLSCGST